MSTEPKVDGLDVASPGHRNSKGKASERGSDRDVVEALGAGDKQRALLLCARRHGHSIGRLCMALLGSQSEADDALQDTLLSAHAAFDGFRGEGSVRAWLFGIARRRCARTLERRGSVLPEESEEDGAPGAEELLTLRRRAEAARALLAEVRPSEREALLLRYVGELSFKEVGEACGIDEAAARKRVSRAIARLRELGRNER
jgi:RNA polymerase sigma-70 factor (ECF subfamily)